MFEGSVLVVPTPQLGHCHRPAIQLINREHHRGWQNFGVQGVLVGIGHDGGFQSA